MKKIYCLLFLLIININSQWVNINTNISTNINNISFVNYNSGYAAAFRVNDSTGILYKTINAGINWYEIEFLPGPVRKVYIPTSNEIFFVNKSHVWFSTNEGNSWVDRYFLGYDLYDIRFQNSTTMYVCGFNQSNLRSVLVRSYDRGFTWNFVFNLENANKLFCIRFPNPVIGYTCGENGQIRKVVEGVTGWNSMTSGTSRNLNSMYFFNENTGFIVGDNSTIIKTENGGYPWFFMNNNFSNIDFKSIEFYDMLTGFICGTGGFIAKTTDGGNSWVQQSTNTNSDLNTLQFINKDTLFCAGNAGKLLRTYNGGNPIGINIISNQIPANFKLEQNYPNPFNPATNIEFEIPENSFVNLTVYDQIGRVVKKLVEDHIKPGIYKYTWDASDLPSGIYFYKLQAGEFVQTKKMILIK